MKSNKKDETNKKIQIVVARYNENLKWLLESPFNKYEVIIYNKGNNSKFNKPDNVKEVIELDNVGKCDHTYLYHIINKYNDLADITVFLPGSVNMENKHERAKKLLYEIEINNSSVFLYNDYYDNIKNDLYDFVMDEYETAYTENKKLNSKNETDLAIVRPFGKWYENMYGKIETNYISYQGIISVSKEDIKKKPKSQYQRLIKQLEISSNPEVGHYIERSWTAIFYPLNTIYIKG
jgi:hypothetical protein